MVGCFDPAIVTIIHGIQHNNNIKRTLEACADTVLSLDYTLNNPDTLTKYKSAAAISEKVLEAVTSLCVAGEKIVTICEKGDKLLEEEISKVYRGKKVTKGEAYLPSCCVETIQLTLPVQEFPTLPPSRHLPLSLHTPHSLPMQLRLRLP